MTEQEAKAIAKRWADGDLPVGVVVWGNFSNALEARLWDALVRAHRRVEKLEDINRAQSNCILNLQSFAADIRDNYDCDSDGHKYNTGCRACEAKRVLMDPLGTK